MNKCKAEVCERKAITKGCCDKHYRRLKKNGSIYNHGSRVVAEGNDIERFHQKYVVDKKTGCWIWTAGTRDNSKGVKYGRHFAEGKSYGAHRYSYKIHNGRIPKGMYVCHKCDTPLCVNPSHLFLGDHIDNMRDMRDKERQWMETGEIANRSVLTNLQAEEIRKSALSRKELSKKYNVSETTIGRIIRMETYNAT